MKNGWRISSLPLCKLIMLLQVEVPPYTLVEVCSVISMVENFTTTYIADAYYSVPSWSGNTL